MSLDLVNTLSQIVAALGVITGLIFVGVQIRQNTRAVRAATFHAVTDSFNTVNLAIGGNAQAARIVRLGTAGLSNLSDDERTQFGFVALSAIRVMETLFYQSRSGVVEKELWATEQNILQALMSAPGALEWWVANPRSFTPAFREFVDRIIAHPEGAATTRAEHGDG